jgi:hypothetical protein
MALSHPAQRFHPQRLPPLPQDIQTFLEEHGWDAPLSNQAAGGGMQSKSSGGTPLEDSASTPVNPFVTVPNGHSARILAQDFENQHSGSGRQSSNIVFPSNFSLSVLKHLKSLEGEDTDGRSKTKWEPSKGESRRCRGCRTSSYILSRDHRMFALCPHHHRNPHVPYTAMPRSGRPC